MRNRHGMSQPSARSPHTPHLPSVLWHSPLWGTRRFGPCPDRLQYLNDSGYSCGVAAKHSVLLPAG